MDWLASLFARHGFLPHGYCFTWSPGLLWSMVVSDSLIAAAYFSIPLAIIYFVRRRGVNGHTWVAGLFSAFIFACGTTHVMDVWTIWSPDYAVQALTKIITAAVSIVTAIMLWPLVQRALKLPSVDQHRQALRALESEVRQREIAQEEALDVEQGLGITLGSIGAGFIATDAEGRVRRMNEVAEQVTGWSQAAATGLSIWSVFVREGHAQRVESRILSDVMTEEGLALDRPQRAVAVSRSGIRTELEIKAALTHGPDGTVRGMVLVFRDMTRLNHAEAEQQRLAAIVESSSDAIVAKTLDGRITNWNRGAERLFGYSADEIIGQSVLCLIPPDRESEEMRILADLRHGLSVPAFETVRRTKSGALIDVSVTISPIYDAAGRVIGGSKIARDITPARLAEQARIKAEQLEAENRRIQEASRLKSQFLANMSHELRTPLNAIIGFADLLHAGAVPVDSPKHREFLGFIGTSGRHLLQLINDVLDLSKVESGKFEFFPEPVDLPQLVKEVCNVLQPTIQRKRMRVEVDIDADLGPLKLDPARLKQVLYNYLSNALKFTPEDGRVRVRAYPDADECFVCEVEDSGIGIAPQDLPRLFVDFQQLDAGYNRQHPGTGLGLALTRRLVEAQGGTVGVRSEPGVGSVFSVRLPRDTTRRDPARSDGGRLLVIENDQRMQSRVAQALSAAGFQVDVAASREQAMQHVQRQTYDAITLDLLLPDDGGLGALALIRNIAASHDSPVIAVTMPVETGDAATFAITNVLCKPIRTDEIVAAMARLRRPDARSPRVMVIDDEAIALDLMRATLKGMGIDAICMQDGRRALQALDEHRPDALILDLMMPEFDGFAVLDALRRTPHWQDLPVFIWTSMILRDEEYGLLARSAQAVVSKGGGAIEGLLQALQRWRPVPIEQPEDSAS